VLIASTNTITITTLNYMRRSPSKFQIMSFVTPYGINLNLGPNGKTWSFDVSDFAPILKGKKRMTMDAGGQWQEDMDIQFLFIVGTPPRQVKDINNVWRVDAIGYQDLLSQKYNEPRDVLLDPSGKFFKLRTTISGHGQEGEFIPQTHLLNINGGANEFSWQVFKACAENPVYPQGGTWVYDRAGWCPGIATDTKESDITPFVTAGAVANIDYNIATASGDSRYIISNQLVTYGDANFTNDASISDVKNPSDKIEYARNNAICGKPIVTLRNTGKAALTSATIEYWVNNNATKNTFQWTGNLALMQSADVELPFSNNLWGGINGAVGNVFHAKVISANSTTDEYAFNNQYNSPFGITSVVPSNFIIWFKPNNFGAESKYQIADANGTILFASDTMVSNKIYKDTFKLGVGCYQLKISDAGEDGLAWWANAAAGNGFCYLKKSNGTNLKVFEPDFGKSVIYNFTIDFPLKYETIFKENIYSVYPNPAHNHVIISGNDVQHCTIELMNTLGQKININHRLQGNDVVVNTQSLLAGVYSIIIQDANGNTTQQKLLIE
jgi:Peptide-N-glycosidase F, C terminal/Secretion system C-terminal sorting domain